ncbi:hypothetical protein [Cellulosimicrobium marinum]|uniref:hypothetical protein n=1 Tax=Cellulosimicrobium marinum TaxID=1638992 RepID=UPI001E4FE2CF|nr:hypothetical protein [Cellulosimicrobium marinum]MCB7136306.1 hypothetical protein [Cellulosimicrobium marinum]
MRRTYGRRGRATLIGLVAAAAAVLAAPTTAAAADGEDYVPTIDLAQPVCDGDVPYLDYVFTLPEGYDPGEDDPLTITWVNPDGEDVVQSGLPLEGRVLWAGAEVDEDGNPVDWPGWSLVDGEWVVGDEYDWVREGVTVRFEVNPSAEEVVAYPPSSPDCLTNPPGGEPTIDVDVLTPVCVDGVSYLDYGVTVTGTPNDTVTLTWDNPDGPDEVQADLPLQGRVLWPGAYPERFVELPADEGWELVNNMWMNTATHGWAVGTVDVTFAVNPEVTVPVTYPQDTSTCFPGTVPVDNPKAPTDEPSLAETGATVGLYAAVAAGLAVVGAAVLMLARRTRKG